MALLRPGAGATPLALVTIPSPSKGIAPGRLAGSPS